VFPWPANRQCVTVRATGDQARAQRTPYRCYKLSLVEERARKGARTGIISCATEEGKRSNDDEVACNGELQWEDQRRTDIRAKRWVFLCRQR